jgi:hypothetical protein
MSSDNPTQDSLCSYPNVSIPIIRFGILGASQLDNQVNFSAPNAGQCPKISNPWATQCSLNLCAQSIMPNVISGQYTEAIVHKNLTYSMHPTIDTTGIAVPNGYDACLDEYGYCWNQPYMQSMYNWFQSQDFGGTPIFLSVEPLVKTRRHLSIPMLSQVSGQQSTAVVQRTKTPPTYK